MSTSGAAPFFPAWLSSDEIDVVFIVQYTEGGCHVTDIFTRRLGIDRLLIGIEFLQI